MACASKQFDLVPLLQEKGSLARERAVELLDQYGVPFTEAGELMTEGRAITVTEEDDKVGMQKARELRLRLRQHRIVIEKKHDELKADSLAYGRAVDLVQRVALEQIKPVEEHLLLQEKYAETKAQERRQTRIAERTALLAAYTDDPGSYHFADLDDEQFDLVLAGAKAKHDERVAAEKAAEDARIAEQKRIEEERLQRQRQAEQEARDAREQAEVARKAQAEAEAKALAERQERERLEAEQRAREAEEAAEKQRAAEEQRRREAAPDREKLLSYVDQLESVPAPSLATPEAQEVLASVSQHLNAATDQYRGRIKEVL